MGEIMNQPDVVVSAAAFVWDSYLTLSNVTFDPDPYDLWPWYLWSLTSRSQIKSNYTKALKHVLFTWCPWPLTLNRVAFDLALVTFNPKARCQIHSVKSLKITFLTFDLWPWPSHITQISSTSITTPNLKSLVQTVPEIWFFICWIFI